MIFYSSIIIIAICILLLFDQVVSYLVTMTRNTRFLSI